MTKLTIVGLFINNAVYPIKTAFLIIQNIIFHIIEL